MPIKVSQNPYVNTLVVLFPDNLKVTDLCIWNRSVCHSLLCLLPWLSWQSWLSKAAGCSDHPESHQQLLCECDVIFAQTDLLCVVWYGEHWDLHCRISKAGLIEYVVNHMSGIDQRQQVQAWAAERTVKGPWFDVFLNWLYILIWSVLVEEWDIL